ncbi:alpha/beta hydrolase [Bacillus sp. HMF5848]|uniref:alpha/beta fold hydrolase n=1 Tax=Bacillus sp. HMF5848 TaxID=2495421 RepID=UPI000F7A7756|nr:alpha/beta hydrolase [Bacillus sp. HMF5848]RSK28359.1 alpha/beta hydrolase [Bacillus sp. HMF5848]
MPKVDVNGIQLYYEIHGEGPPLLLIEGLGYASWMWNYNVTELSRHFSVIVFDNRGVGKSDKPDVEYTIELFADDAAELVRTLGFEKVHVLGVSMGGFVAQEFAIKYPEIVDKLILCSTSFGGPNMIPIPQDTLAIMMKAGSEDMTVENMKYGSSTALNESTLADKEDVLDCIVKNKLDSPQPKFAYQRQLFAGASFNAEDRVATITADTLVLAGKGDRVVPYKNSFLLQEKMPQSQVAIIEDGGHVFFMERPDETNSIIINFLKDN